jgi:hypothetical protein
MNGSSAIRGSTAKAQQNHAIAANSGPAEIWLAKSLVNVARHLCRQSRRLGLAPWRDTKLSAVTGYYDGRTASLPPFQDFMILTDFSRCQGHAIGRVSRPQKRPCRNSRMALKIRIFHDSFVI